MSAEHAAFLRSERWAALNRVLMSVCSEDRQNGEPLPHGPLIAAAKGRAGSFEEHRALGVLADVLDARTLGVAFSKRDLFAALMDLRPEHLA